MSSRIKGLGVLAFALTLPLTACDSGDPEFGSVTLKLTDAEGPGIHEAWVTFTDIYLQGGDDDGDPESSRVYLMEDGLEEYELTSLAGAVADLVVGATVPTGTYGQLRVVLGDACIVTDEGVYTTDGYDQCEGEVVGGLNLTSTDNPNSGWKVQLQGLEVDGDQEVVLLDFLVDESFYKMAGGSGQYVLHPVIKGGIMEFSGGFDITLSDPDALLPEGFTLDQFSVTMTPSEGDEEVAAFTDDDEDGVFEADFDYEQPGLSYTFVLTGPDGLNWTVAPGPEQMMDLASGQTLGIDWVIASAEVATE